MKILSINTTEFTPNIFFNIDELPFLISGVSRPENANEFYEPVIKWLEEYSDSPLEKTEIHFKFDYFNTSSLKYFLIILSKFKIIEESGKEVKIVWFYDEEDDSMLEAGNNLEELSEIVFNFKINI